MLAVPQNVTAPTTITLNFKSPLFGPDLTTVTAVNAGLQRRDSTTTTLAFVIVSATPRELLAQYTFVGGEITTTGAYFLAPQLSVQGGAVPSETVPLYVNGPYNNIAKLEQDVWLLATVPIPSLGNVRNTWATISASGPASPFLPFMALDLRASPLSLTLWKGLDGDIAELTDVYNASGAHNLTLNGTSPQLVPLFNGTYAATATYGSLTGFTVRLRFQASTNLWIPR